MKFDRNSKVCRSAGSTCKCCVAELDLQHPSFSGKAQHLEAHKKCIASADDDRDSFMKDGEELEGDDDGGRESRDEDEEGDEEKNGDNYEGGRER